MTDYLKEAFLFRWNLLLFARRRGRGGADAAGRTCCCRWSRRASWRTSPAWSRFRGSARRSTPRSTRPAARPAAATPAPQRRAVAASRCSRACRPTRGRASSGCTRAASRCAAIAAGVRGAAGDQRRQRPRRSARRGSIACSGCSSACCVEGRARSVPADDERAGDLDASLDELRKSLAAAQAGGDERIVRSLQDSIAMGELRLDNYGRAKKNARVRRRSSSIASKARSRRSPRWRSTGRIRTSSAARSTRPPRACGRPRRRSASCSTSPASADQLEEPPAILEADLRGGADA